MKHCSPALKKGQTSIFVIKTASFVDGWNVLTFDL